MARKSKKKGTPSSSSQNVSAKGDCTIAEDESMHQSLNDTTGTPHRFMISIDHKNTYSKLLSSNNVLLHSSIVKSFQAPRYFIVEGKNYFSLCVAFHLKDIKRSSIVFPRGCTTFQTEELVTLHPYNRCVLNAANVTVAFNTEVTIDKDLKEKVLWILVNKRYFYAGMTIKECPYEFTITNISCKESDTICDVNSLNFSDSNNSFTSLYSSTNTSLTETNHRKLLSSTAHDKSKSFLCNQSSSQLNSMFSSMCLNDSNLQDSKNSSECCNQSNVSDRELFSKTNIPVFYTLTYATSITVIGNSTELETRSPCFSQIGGLKDELHCVKCFIDRFLNSEISLHELGILLLLGPPGTGKTLTLDAIRNEYEVHIEEILWYTLYLKTLSEAEQELRQIFYRASHRTPCIIIVDDFHMLCPKEKDAQSQCISGMMSYLIKETAGNKIIIVAASNNLEYDAEVLDSYETEIEKIKFRIPTAEEREDIFEKLLLTRQHDLTPEDIKKCVMHSQGFTGRDIKLVLHKASSFRSMKANENQASGENSNTEVIEFDYIKQALKYQKPSIVESNMEIKKVRWSDIGGMKAVKEKLKDIIEGPLKYQEVYKHYDVTPSRGILLFGPPGCSKTMIAKALATECDLNFISKNVSDIQNKYVGESEKAVRDLFLLAREKSPCIIFLDEVDALIADRGSSTGSGVERRIVNSFLQEMDGLEELRNVIIIAATNRPDRLDPAFVRNGRINHFIYVPLPDLEAREEILKLQMKNRTVAEDIDYKNLALKTEGYSGAEIVNLCNEAAFQLLAEDIDCKSATFTMRHFENAMKCVLPRTPMESLDFYKDYNTRFGSK